MATVTLGSPAGKWVLASTILASAMAFIDSTALNVVLPSLQKSLHANAPELFWILNAYLLMLAALILVGGSLGDRLGRKRVFMIGIFVFICASAACGLAPSTGALIAFRVIQGIGGALMIPGSLSLLSSSIDDKERGKAIGTWSAITTIVTIGGPVVGGALADAGLWRYIFFINVPIGLIALGILWRRVEESKEAEAEVGRAPKSEGRNRSDGRALDLPGVLAIALGLAALTFGFLRMPAVGFNHWTVSGSLSLGVLLLFVFIAIERKSPYPMMPLHLFANPIFTGVNLLTFFLYAGLSSAMLFLSLDLVQAQGYSQLESGLTFLPFTLLMISIARPAGMLADKWGPRPFLIAGPALAGWGMLLLSFVGLMQGPSSYWTSFLPGVLVLGSGMSFTVAPLTTTVMNAASDQYSGVASGINNALTRVSNVFANAIFGALAVLFFTQALHQQLDAMPMKPEARQLVMAQAADLGNAHVPAGLGGNAAIAAAYRSGFILAYRQIMRLSACLAFAGAIMGWLFVRPRRGSSSA
jgi:EmrB/QacA subfamily drug resistance transporter